MVVTRSRTKPPPPSPAASTPPALPAKRKGHPKSVKSFVLPKGKTADSVSASKASASDSRPKRRRRITKQEDSDAEDTGMFVDTIVTPATAVLSDADESSVESDGSASASDFEDTATKVVSSPMSVDDDDDDDAVPSDSDSGSSSDDFADPRTVRQSNRFAARAYQRRVRNNQRLSDSSESLEQEQERARRAVMPVAELMPVFGDMKLLLSQQPLPTASELALANLGASRPKKKTWKRKKDGQKTHTEILEGDLSDGVANSNAVDPRSLPLDHVDYSKYSVLFANHPHLHHAWSSLGSPRTPMKIDQPQDLKIKLLPFQQEGVEWMAHQEQTMFKGGILADEMGMGKTLQTIALMLVNRGSPTLVICPTVALLQWKSEIEAATDALSVFVYYGNDRKKILDEQGNVNAQEFAKYNVVLTTYAVMESGFRRERMGFRLKGVLHREASVLHSIDWFRIVLDEAHNIKDRSSNSARAAFELKAQRTWSLTGTPLHNRVGELYSLIRLSKCDPFSMYFCHVSACKTLHWGFVNSKHCNNCGHKYTTHFCYWNMHILKPIQQHSVASIESKVGFKKLGRLLDNIMLRRTKVERAQDMGLPPRIVVTRRDKFSPDEEDMYRSLFSDYQREFDTYERHGTVLNNYANIFELITRMRLAANHPDLLRLKVDAKAKVGADSSDTLVCVICNEEAEDPILSKCKHVFCRADAQMYVESTDSEAVLRCPMCYAQLDIDLVQPEMKHSLGGGKNDCDSNNATIMESMMSTPHTMDYRRSIVNRIDMKHWKSSTKIEALVEELSRHRQGNANIKSIVFSQFVNFLDLIQWRLNRAGFSVCRLDGRMSPSQRDAVIRTFMTHPEYTVFLVSLKAGGVALNLTEASNVYLADCWWNPSVEVQAMDRIHRMGQYRPIKVTRIIIENSIESRIVALQVKKQHLVNSTIGRDSKSLDNLSAQDMQFLFSP
ncbi:DNA repair protein rad16 [Coemansia linderi]|uniref:DNA repair protein rad16 n=1 Tax=Coemansia linderi TaxID=2663919 RepID=A0ACC1KP38_9FUNG|nr:DNA repair protein rad16 [Coemansia linderi]